MKKKPTKSKRQPTPYMQELWSLLWREYGLIATQSDMDEIMRVCRKIDKREPNPPPPWAWLRPFRLREADGAIVGKNGTFYGYGNDKTEAHIVAALNGEGA